jgi:CCR4-NOT transcriptional regulation complex NOT5 subunit
MLSNIINQIQQERDQDRHLSKKTGTNQIHDFTRIPGHRRVGPNIVFGKVPAASAFTPTATAPRTTHAPEPTTTTTSTEPTSTPATTEPIITPNSQPIQVEVKQTPTRMTKTAMKKKQKEEQMAKKREGLVQAPTPEPIEIKSTVSNTP